MRRLLHGLLPPGRVRDGLLGDLDELYVERAARGRLSADLWYGRQVLSAAVHYPARRVWAWGRWGAGAVTIDQIARDLGYALRTLRASPGFTAATVVTLGLGIGAVLTIDAHGRLGQPVAGGVEAPEGLVYLGEGPAACRRCVSMTGAGYATVRDRARSFERVSMFVEWEPTLRGMENGELVDGLLVMPEIFSTLGVRPLLGRLLVPEDALPASERVVVLGEGAWRRRLGGERTVLGRTLILDRTPYTVVGVVPGGVVFPHAGDPTEVWAPLLWTPEPASETTGPEYQVVARLRDGTTVPMASSEVGVLAAQSVRETPGLTPDRTYLVTPLLEQGAFATVPPPLVAAVGLVLLTAWINVAGLLVARLSARGRELAVRLALGAGARRVVRQLLAESMLLGALGALCGVAGAAVGARVLLGTAQPVDSQAFFLAMALGLGSGVAISAWPAVRFARPGRARRLADASRTSTGGTDAARGRRILSVAQVAFATVLLSATGLLARTFQNIYRIEPGFSADGVLALRVWDPPDASGNEPPASGEEPPASDEPRTDRIDRLIRTLEAVPGVQRAGAVLGLPFGSGAPQRSFEIEGRVSARDDDRPRARMQAATPGYFAALEIPLLGGRGFSDADGADAARVAVINGAAAERFFRGGDAIGRGLIVDGSRWEIVGVVGTVFHGDQEQPATPEVYRPMRQWPQRSLWLAVGARGRPDALGPEVRAAVRGFDPDIAVTRLLTMDALRAGSMSAEQRIIRLMAAFALAAVLMSAIGLYGLVSYSVSQRTREFGVRTALGAPGAAVLRLVLGQGVRLAAAGAAFGVVGSFAALHVMRSLLFGVSPADPLTLGAAVAVVCGISLLSAWVPAWRATGVDPVGSLSRE
jgi:predicted permease